ncbi:hypothetical protein GKC30_06125 [Pseudodesulfovibrio sp. F-1]|uniref:Uncharacterized protein n=1 Tax=Pseudodesulfovibrio alkaliphilus TaxID=2661613 RepID=A0A7K1KM87_9BACT|nr:hypothetical protein [Pseudodesulfovibrio alkaliphilus]MUM77206.1 hypothetical protein [Pseudodesulfovibrio alkaliphilus]
MKQPIALAVLVLLLVSSPGLAGELPLTLAGFTLGRDMVQYKGHCQGPALVVPDIPFLTERSLTPDAVPGIRGGSLTHGNCLGEDKLLRIKLKFHDTSQKFFNKLVKEYTDRFGKPDSYQGDAFRNVIAWQWDFSQGGEAMSVLVMWSRDKEMRPGVSIKMTLESGVEAEYQCFMAASGRQEQERGGPTAIRSLDEFIPR